MTKRPSTFKNIILMNVSWFACILGAAKGFPEIGPVIVALSLLVQFGKEVFNPFLFLFFILVAMIGTIADQILIQLEAISFSCCSFLPNNYPLWMLALWVSFATAFFSSLKFIRSRYIIGFIFGFLGGAAAYYAGAELNAIYLGSDLEKSLFQIAVLWGTSVPVLGLIHRRLFK
ncbi:MAG: DUF2878 domain-containing protein [bacterium]|nr:DUF2878 domain-containing protein [bacterium]